MAQRRSRADRQAETRQLLVEAAFRCFEARGFAATTLEHIAEEAGLTTGAVYSNFASKEALFLELLGRIDPQPVDVSMLADTTCSLADRFRRFGEVNAQDVDLAPTTMATWYEVRAFALRNPRARAAAHDVVLQHMHAGASGSTNRRPRAGCNPSCPDSWSPSSPRPSSTDYAGCGRSCPRRSRLRCTARQHSYSRTSSRSQKSSDRRLVSPLATAFEDAELHEELGGDAQP